ncbi:hypothetical protein EDB83DRAFT_2506592 [Lactarius deliciosus]|nr:hypothetical protein EDB83DRAFT_2506592 [Lactarius deliciosus]
MPKVQSKGSKRSSAAAKKACAICMNHFRPQAFAAHVRKCEREKREEEELLEYKKEVIGKAQAQLAGMWYSALFLFLVHFSFTFPPQGASRPSMAVGTSPVHGAPELDTELDSDSDIAAVTIRKIRTEYHPNSRKSTKTRSVDDPSHNPSSSAHQSHPEPWAPFFRTREDFVLSEILLESGLSNNLSEKLLELFRLCKTGKGEVTVERLAEFQTAWEHASLKLTPFELSTVSVPYKSKNLEFDVHYRPLWDWVKDLIQSSQLAKHFHWDAERIFRCTGDESVRVFNEPWSGDVFWDAQSQIPQGGNPLAFILYADKTKLSSFGTTQGYPVVARCANIPTTIRNGNGFGSGRVVGWLPIVKEDPMERNKPAFVNFKRTVWHESFFVIIQSIVTHSKTGCWLECGDGVKRWLFPMVLILSADYEEQCVMSLIRGTKAKSPCPICLVKNDELVDLTKTWPLRTAAHSQELVQQARGHKRVKDREALLSAYGLRNVNNVFWTLSHTDPHRALSFDRLHSNNSGVFGYHLWGAFKALIGRYSREEEAKVDAQCRAVPRWSGLYHFDEVMNVSFTDGTKHEDLSKIIVFAAHNIIEQSDMGGWLLIRALRSFTIVDLYLSFEEHTQLTIAAGRRELAKFGDLMQAWDFPKMHALVHSFNDIEMKGATRNYNTKPNEKLHGHIKKAYARRTNFKDVAPQILKIEHAKFVSLLIRTEIDEIDKIASETTDDEGTTQIHDQATPPVSTPTPSVVPTPDVVRSSKVFIDGHIALRSRHQQATVFSFGDSFRQRLSTWLTAELAAIKDQLPCTINFGPTDHITEYRSIKVVYESKVDQKQYIDLLYCSPMFHGGERRDCVIVHAVAGPFFARLLLIFTVSIADDSYSVCLVQPLDAPVVPRRIKDRELGLHRVRARLNKTEFIFARTIIRGAPLIGDFDKAGDFYVMDVVDHTGDLFLRCNEIFM